MAYDPIGYPRDLIKWGLEDGTIAFFPDAGRAMTTIVTGARGTGKSRGLGRILIWQDALRGDIPVILFDPVFGSTMNFLDKTIRLLKAKGEDAAEFEKRLVYVDMSGQLGYTVGFPIFYRLGKETLHTIANRFADVTILTDPNLASASIQGANRIKKLSAYVGEILFALDCQITEAHSLLSEPEKWKPLFGKAIRAYPEVKDAITLFEQEYMSLPERERQTRLDSYFGKILPFSLDPVMKAMFGTSEGLSWAEVVRERKIVLLDFSKENDLEKRRFKMFWIFNSLVDYIKYRGSGKTLTPIAIYVDELTAMLNLDTTSGGDAFASYLDTLINVTSRNANCWITLSFQELFQLPEKLRKTMLTAGTLLLGATTDEEGAIKLAERLFRYNPYMVKKTDPVMMQYQGVVFNAGERTSEFSIEEQKLLHSYRFTALPKFHFFARIARREGDVAAPLQHLTIEQMDAGQWPQEALVERTRAILAAHSGRPISEVIAEIDQRRRERFLVPTSAQKPAKLKEAHGNKTTVPSISIHPTSEPEPVPEATDDDIY